MDIQTVLEQAQKVTSQVAYAYHLNPDDLLSHCSVYLPGLLARVDTSRPERAQLAFIRRSVKGYCQHWVRDRASMIRTPRGKPFIPVSYLHENIKETNQGFEDLHEWLLTGLESETYGRRLANAYLRFMDS